MKEHRMRLISGICERDGRWCGRDRWLALFVRPGVEIVVGEVAGFGSSSFGELQKIVGACGS